MDPDLAGYLEVPARVELVSPVNRGMLIVDRRPTARSATAQSAAQSAASRSAADGHPVRIAIQVDSDRVLSAVLDGLLG